MPSLVEWDSAQQDVVYALMNLNSTIRDLTDVQNRVSAMLDTASRPVTVVLDFEENHIVRGVTAHLREVVTHPVMFHKNLRLVILVLGTDLQKRIGQVFATLAKRPVRTVATVDEAQQLIATLT